MNNTATNYELIKSLEAQVIALKQQIRKEKEKKAPDTWKVVEKKSRYRTNHRYSNHISRRFYIYSENEGRNVMQVYGDSGRGTRNSVYLSKFPQMLALITNIAEENNARTAKHFMTQAKGILAAIESDIKKHDTYEI